MALVHVKLFVSSILHPSFFPSSVCTMTHVVLSAPVYLKVIDVGPRHLTLGWSHPYNFTHTITHYDVYYSSETWGEVGVVHINSTVTMVTINNMEEATIYVIRVSAVNSAGPGHMATVQGRTYSDGELLPHMLP